MLSKVCKNLHHHQHTVSLFMLHCVIASFVISVKVRSMSVYSQPHHCRNSHAIWDHTVLSSTWQRWHSRLYPRQLMLVLDLPTSKGCKGINIMPHQFCCSKSFCKLLRASAAFILSHFRHANSLKSWPAATELCRRTQRKLASKISTQNTVQSSQLTQKISDLTNADWDS